MQSRASRYENARRAFLQLKGHWLANEPLERWSLPSDRHLPSALVVLPLGDVLARPYAVLLETKGVGESKLEKLIVLIERALAELSENSTASNGDFGSGSPEMLREPISCPITLSFPDTDELSLSNLTVPIWDRICQCIKSHSLGHYPLGRFAETLDELPRGLWSCPVSDFANYSAGELAHLKGYGEQRISCVLKILLTTTKLVAGCPADTHLGIKIFPTRIEQITSWISRVLHDDRLPSYLSLCQNFVQPLLRQIECDLGSQPAEMIERRLGVEGEPETLQEVSESFGLTRERIRQLTLRAPEVMNVRWPEGKHLLDDFFEKIHASGQAARQVCLIQRTLDILFNVETDRGVSRDEVIQAWDMAGRYKETPMSDNELRLWIGGNFPELVPTQGINWITSESLSVEYGGRRLFFSNDHCDELLHRLYTSGHATSIGDLVDVDEREQRNLRMKLQRDLRFTEDEDHCFLPTEFHGFTRDSVGWHVNLKCVEPGKNPSRTSVSVDSIVAAALGGLLQSQIFDVTVWGFHRFVNEQLACLYHARLPDSISPIVLSDMVVRQSGKRIRPMRRRRLRWDSVDKPSMAARGKRGWVGFVVQQFGVPIVIDELGEMLSRYYQDYDTYVIDQLDLDSDEEGASDFGVSLSPGIAHKLPSVLIPDGWSLDTSRENVSEGVRLSVARAITLLQESRIRLSDLDHLPWFVELVKRNSYGANLQRHAAFPRQTTKTNSVSLRDEHESDDEHKSRNESLASTEPRQNVDELLKRFL